MKKILIRVLIVVGVLLVVGVVVLGLFLDSAVKKGVETFGPQLTEVSVKVDGVSLSLLGGGGNIKGLVVGNPEGYTASNSITLGSASVAISPGSLLSDKVIIRHLRIEAPEINIEGSPTKNNLTKILENLQAATGGRGTNATQEAGPSKKLQVNEFLLTGAKVNYTPPGLGGSSIPLVLPDIKFENLGTGPEGITVGDLANRVMKELIGDVAKVAAQELSKQGIKSLGSAGDSADKATKSITDLFKKKEK